LLEFFTFFIFLTTSLCFIYYMALKKKWKDEKGEKENRSNKTKKNTLISYEKYEK